MVHGWKIPSFEMDDKLGYPHDLGNLQPSTSMVPMAILAGSLLFFFTSNWQKEQRNIAFWRSRLTILDLLMLVILGPTLVWKGLWQRPKRCQLGTWQIAGTHHLYYLGNSHFFVSFFWVIWRFPKSWGYPDLSSIFDRNFPWNKPSSYRGSFWETSIYWQYGVSSSSWGYPFIASWFL